jgi:hypothetical protein
MFRIESKLIKPVELKKVFYIAIERMNDSIMAFLKLPLKGISVLIVKYLQKRYKTITVRNTNNQSNQVISKLILIQSILYYFKSQFKAYGYFHPSCVWSKKDEQFFRKLFPKKDDFEEFKIVVWHNPEAVMYYHNEIWNLSKQKPPIYEKEIKKQLIEWKDWN